MITEEYQPQLNAIIQDSKRRYSRTLNIALSQQRSQGVFKHAVTSVADQLFRNRSSLLSSTALSSTTLTSENETTIAAITASDLDHLLDQLIEHALHTHRTSCALSNFEAEHRPDSAYIAEVLTEVEALRNQFMQQIALE